ncbi:hypothetical protein GOB07_32125 [Sinorhizobium meliloti]|nr:hypothetical protein CDO24_31815 [Sinorhizobium meliloti]ASQ12611.1 hypothetical protein CDO22_20985 [Sinorhizobium meliloti]MDW9401405.1 hypothetical protein [Sinorhizobium meliloti]MDW9412820.1 hypothetical protein [Sinorhizobium meliloti]MDW9445998.1 hypothetical protein [Sinorhizobium meliloti]
MNMVTAAPSASFWPSLMIWARIVACRPPHPALPQPIAASGIVSGSCALKRITQHARSSRELIRAIPLSALIRWIILFPFVSDVTRMWNCNILE